MAEAPGGTCRGVEGLVPVTVGCDRDVIRDSSSTAVNVLCTRPRATSSTAANAPRATSSIRAISLHTHLPPHGMDIVTPTLETRRADSEELKNVPGATQRGGAGTRV